MLKNIAIIGGNFAALYFAYWYRKLSNRDKLTLFTNNKILGIPPRRFFSYLSGGISKEALTLLPKEYIRKVLYLDIKYTGEKTDIDLDKLKEKYDIVVVTSDALINGVPLSHLSYWEEIREKIVSNKRVILTYCPNALVALGIFLRNGVRVYLTDIDEHSLLPIFDDDTAKVITSKLPGQVLLKPERKENCIKMNLCEVEPYTLVKVDKDNMVIDNNKTFLIGPCLNKLGVLGEDIQAFYEEQISREAIALAHRIARNEKIPVTRIFSAQVDNYSLFSCGISATEAKEKGYNIATTKIAFNRESVLKVIADRERKCVIGAQGIVKGVASSILALFSLAIITRAKLVDTLGIIGEGKVFELPPYDPSLKCLYSLWRKIYARRIN